MYVENMLRLEKGSLREFLGSKMVMAVMDRLLDLDVSIITYKTLAEINRQKQFSCDICWPLVGGD